MQFILSIDRAVFFFFQGLQRPWLDYLLAWPTRLGETGILFPVLILLILIFDRKNAFRVITGLAISLITVQYASPALKAFFHRPRPHLFWENVHVIFKKPINDAFPSGHTAIIFAAAFILSHYYPKTRWWAYGVAVWVAITRIYVGVHYPSDLIGGAFLGVAVGWGTCAFLNYYERVGSK